MAPIHENMQPVAGPSYRVQKFNNKVNKWRSGNAAERARKRVGTGTWTRALASLLLGVVGFLLLGAPSCPGPAPATDGGPGPVPIDDGGRVADAAAGADLRGPQDLGPLRDASGGDLAPRRNSGDCDTDLDCGGGRCVELSPGGYRVCSQPVAEATSCPGRGPDECCKTTDCKTGACYEWPLSPYCGGAFPVPRNVCAEEGCTTLADCGGGAVCVPKGALGYKVRACLPATCLRDSDCTASPGGTCAPVRKPCCAGTYGLYCVYPGGCRTSADCPGGYCDLVGDTPTCRTGPPLCPP